MSGRKSVHQSLRDSGNLYAGCYLSRLHSGFLIHTSNHSAVDGTLMSGLGFDLIWFGVILVLFVHTGLLTPPFGMCVFSVKAALEGSSIRRRNF